MREYTLLFRIVCLFLNFFLTSGISAEALGLKRAKEPLKDARQFLPDDASSVRTQATLQAGDEIPPEGRAGASLGWFAVRSTVSASTRISLTPQF